MLCHVSVHSGAFCLRHGARDPISVLTLIESLYFLILTIYLNTGPGVPPYSSSAFYILELSSKNILKTLTANFMNNFHVGNPCFPYKALEENAKFV